MADNSQKEDIRAFYPPESSGRIQTMTTPAYARTIEDLLQSLQTDIETGLSSLEAEKRLKEYGKNELQKEGGVSPWALLLEQFKNVLVVILLLAVGVSAVLGHTVEAVTIAVIVLFAVGLGFVQEYRAERAMEALKKLAAPVAKALRDGRPTEVNAADVVPGDVILLSAGDRVPADARVIESVNLKTEEAALTGESLPAEKQSEALEGDALNPGDQRNMLFAGTAVTYGRGRAVVTGTGMATEFGKIATMLKNVEQEETPLQRNLDKVGKTLAKAAFAIVLVISALGWLRGESLIEILLFGIALAVAVVPEALPAVVTVSLAIGVQRMVKRNALIRRLPAVETLGGTTIICTDKTGTLTKDEMTVRQVYTAGVTYDVSGTGYAPEGAFTADGKPAAISAALRETLQAGTLSSDARLVREDGAWDVQGDPTEGAIVVAAAKLELTKDALEKRHPRTAEIPFTSETKRMTTLHRHDDGPMAYTKGAPEMLLPHCTREWCDEGEKALDDAGRTRILDRAKAMAERGMRVLAIARKGTDDIADAQAGLKFLGLVGMIDPPRPEAKKAIETCKRAGIRVLMITGDHPVTAAAIAQELGIISSGGSGEPPSGNNKKWRGRSPDLPAQVVIGADLERMDDQELKKRLGGVAVFARVSPAHKLRVVTALQEEGHVAAMTGDGVNDAPALKKADIGVAMGVTGTDVSKEAAAMTLTDDNFASIVAAVEEGRAIYGNIKKYLMYLLSANIGEIGLMTGATILGWPLPLSAVQILYVNLATDGLPALALALDPPPRDLMDHPPRDPRRGIFTKPVVLLLLIGGLWSTFVNLSLYFYADHSGRPHDEAMTMVFVALVLIEFFKAYGFRSTEHSILFGLLRNRWLNMAVLWELVLLFAIVYWTPFHTAFGTFSLSLGDWALLLPAAFTIVPVLELGKFLTRRLKA